MESLISMGSVVGLVVSVGLGLDLAADGETAGSGVALFWSDAAAAEPGGDTVVSIGTIGGDDGFGARVLKLRGQGAHI